MRKQRQITNYDSMHKKLKRIRGKASGYQCSDCKERPANHWSLNADIDVTTLLVQRGGREDGRVFSTDIMSYSPRCAKCHSKQDREHGLERAPSGVTHKVRTHCTVDGCDRPNKAKGMCELHYRRELRRRNDLGTESIPAAGATTQEGDQAAVLPV